MGKSFFAWINGETLIVGIAKDFLEYKDQVVGVKSTFQPSHRGFKTRPAALQMVTTWVRNGEVTGHDASITMEEFKKMKTGGIEARNFSGIEAMLKDKAARGPKKKVTDGSAMVTQGVAAAVDGDSSFAQRGKNDGNNEDDGKYGDDETEKSRRAQKTGRRTATAAVAHDGALSTTMDTTTAMAKQGTAADDGKYDDDETEKSRRAQKTGGRTATAAVAHDGALSTTMDTKTAMAKQGTAADDGKYGDDETEKSRRAQKTGRRTATAAVAHDGALSTTMDTKTAMAKQGAAADDGKYGDDETEKSRRAQKTGGRTATTAVAHDGTSSAKMDMMPAMATQGTAAGADGDSGLAQRKENDGNDEDDEKYGGDETAAGKSRWVQQDDNDWIEIIVCAWEIEQMEKLRDTGQAPGVIIATQEGYEFEPGFEGDPRGTNMRTTGDVAEAMGGWALRQNGTDARYTVHSHEPNQLEPPYYIEGDGGIFAPDQKLADLAGTTLYMVPVYDEQAHYLSLPFNSDRVGGDDPADGKMNGCGDESPPLGKRGRQSISPTPRGAPSGKILKSTIGGDANTEQAAPDAATAADTAMTKIAAATGDIAEANDADGGMSDNSARATQITSLTEAAAGMQVTTSNAEDDGSTSGIAMKRGRDVLSPDPAMENDSTGKRSSDGRTREDQAPMEDLAAATAGMQVAKSNADNAGSTTEGTMESRRNLVASEPGTGVGRDGTSVAGDAADGACSSDATDEENGSDAAAGFVVKQTRLQRKLSGNATFNEQLDRQHEQAQQQKKEKQRQKAARQQQEQQPWERRQLVMILYDGKEYPGYVDVVETNRVRVIYDEKKKDGTLQYDWRPKREVRRIGGKAVPTAAGVKGAEALRSSKTAAKGNSNGTTSAHEHGGASEPIMCSKDKCRSCFVPFQCPFVCPAHAIPKTTAELVNHLNDSHCVVINTQGAPQYEPAWMQMSEGGRAEMQRRVNIGFCSVCKFAMPDDGDHVECKGRYVKPERTEVESAYNMPVDEKQVYDTVRERFPLAAVADLIRTWTTPEIDAMDSNTVRRPNISTQHQKMFGTIQLVLLENFYYNAESDDETERNDAVMNWHMATSIICRVAFESKGEFGRHPSAQDACSVKEEIEGGIYAVHQRGVPALEELLAKYRERKDERKLKQMAHAQSDYERGITKTTNRVLDAALVAAMVQNGQTKQLLTLLGGEIKATETGEQGQHWLPNERFAKALAAAHPPLRDPPQQDEPDNALAKDLYPTAAVWLQHLADSLTVKGLRAAAEDVKSGASPGGGGTRAEHWGALFAQTPVAQIMVLILKKLCTAGANSYMPGHIDAYGEVRQMMFRSQPGALSKPKKECDCPGDECIGNHGRGVNCEKSLSKIFSKAGVGKETTKELKARTKKVCTVANQGGCASSAMHVQYFQNATILEARLIMSADDRDIESLKSLPVTAEIDAKAMYTRIDRLRYFRQSANEPRLQRLHAMWVLKYGSATQAEYMFARSNGSLSAIVEQGGMIGCDVVGKGAMLGITQDTEEVRRRVGVDVWKRVDLHVSTDNIVMGGTMADVFTMINAFVTLLDGAGHDGHWQYPESDRVFHRFFDLPIGMASDGITAEQLPNQREMNACMENVWQTMFPKNPLKEGIQVEMTVARILGVPVGTGAGIASYLQAKVAHFQRITELLVNIPNVDWADVNDVIVKSLTKRYQHILEAVEPRLVMKFATQLDATVNKMYETMYSKAGNGASVHTERVLSPEALRIMHLSTPDEAGGLGIPSMVHLVNAGVYLVSMRCRADMAKAMRFPHEQKVQAYIRQYPHPAVQMMLDRVHRITSPAYRAFVVQAIPRKAVDYLKSRTNPQAIRKRVMTVFKMNEITQVEANTQAYDGKGVAADIYATQAARKRTVNAGQVWTNSRSSHETKISSAGFMLQFCTAVGWPIPGTEDLDGTTCACTGMTKQVDSNHAHTCKASGRTSVHNTVRDGFARAIQLHGGAEARWHRTEVRGANYFYPKGDNRGPDIAATVHGVPTYFDVTGLANMSATHQKHFRSADKAVIQHKRTLGATTTPRSDARHVATPMDTRFDVKRNSEDARLAAVNHAMLAPCVFAYNGGIHMEFDKMLVKMFARSKAPHVFAFPDDIRDALHHVRQSITATIVNSHADYYIKNQRKAYQTRRPDTELQWWRTTYTHEDPGTGLHAMAAAAAQQYGSMDGNESDDDGNGPVPGNGGSTGVTVHRGLVLDGGAPAARSHGSGGRASAWGGRGRGLSVRGRGYGGGGGGARGPGRSGYSGTAGPPF